MTLKNSGLPDIELARMISLKSQAGAEALYDRYAAALWLCIIRIVPQKEVAEKILEQTFIQAWGSFESYSPKPGTVLTWMMQIARSRAQDAVTYNMSKTDPVIRIDSILNPMTA